MPWTLSSIAPRHQRIAAQAAKPFSRHARPGASRHGKQDCRCTRRNPRQRLFTTFTSLWARAADARRCCRTGCFRSGTRYTGGAEPERTALVRRLRERLSGFGYAPDLGVVRELVKRGWLTPDADGALTLAAAGRSALVNVLLRIRAYEDALLSGIDRDQTEVLKRLLRVIGERVQAGDVGLAPPSSG